MKHQLTKNGRNAESSLLVDRFPFDEARLEHNRRRMATRLGEAEGESLVELVVENRDPKSDRTSYQGPKRI